MRRLIGICIVLVTASIAYHFVYVLPKNERVKFELQNARFESEEKEKEEKSKKERDLKQREVAQSVQKDCLENTKNSVDYNFGLENTYESPLFYPYDDIDSFNKNTRLLTALRAYGSCIKNDPRFSEENEIIRKIRVDEISAFVKISGFLKETATKKSFCDQKLLLTPTSENYCERISKEDNSN